ncbi:MAG: L,D-transpeptidase [Acidimicrobiales bacterium]
MVTFCGIVAGCGADSGAGTGPGAVAGPELVVEPTVVSPAPGGTVVATAAVDEVVAHVHPTASSDVVARLAHPRPLGGPLVLVVVGPLDGPWLEVELPIRPNGSTGWISVDDVTLSRNPYRIDIDVDTHRLLVTDDGRVVLETMVAIGTGATPTPLGSFYLTELVQPPDPTGPYGTYAYGLSGYSETLESFNGGDGVVGIHGTDEPGSLGTDVSHGCVRVANDTIEQMASFLPLGTRVVISDSP